MIEQVASAIHSEFDPAIVSAHYGQERGKKYLDSQHELMKFGGFANAPKFSPYIKPTDTVLDFGCGPGYLLENLDCRVQWGVEVNPHALPLARTKGICVHTSIDEFPSNSVDVVISNHALEHTKRPLDEVTKLYRVLRPGGLLVMVVPCEGISRGFVKNDINHHLYTWSPMNLGHLVLEAGYEVLECKRFIHKWPPHHQWIAKHFGRGMFDLTGTIWAYLTPSMSQVRVVARRPTK